MKPDKDNRGSARSPKGREARGEALDVFIKAKNVDTHKAELAKIAKLRALRLAKEAADKGE